MQRYNIDRDGDLKKAENGYVYLASEVDARIAELEKKLTDLKRCDFCGGPVSIHCAGHCDNDD